MGQTHVVTVRYLFSMLKNNSSLIRKEIRSETEKLPENNAVLIGQKPVMNYVLACITLFHSGSEEINVKARGRAISRAVDVVEVVTRKFLPDVEVQKINIGTEQVQTAERDNSTTNISTIEITLSR